MQFLGPGFSLFFYFEIYGIIILAFSFIFFGLPSIFLNNNNKIQDGIFSLFFKRQNVISISLLTWINFFQVLFLSISLIVFISFLNNFEKTFGKQNLNFDSSNYTLQFSGFSNESYNKDDLKNLIWEYWRKIIKKNINLRKEFSNFKIKKIIFANDIEKYLNILRKQKRYYKFYFQLNIILD